MQFLDLTLPTAAENVALDEALLETAENSTVPQETLRLWESTHYAVVVGRSSRVADEVDVAYCSERNIPILRRCSGGAAVVIGPGCLMYAVVLSHILRPDVQLIERAHHCVMSNMSAAFGPLVNGVRYQGTCDLTFDSKKFSGNSLRCKRTHLLYHGTVLYGFDLATISACLRTPPRQPEYRASRGHADFVTNLKLSANEIRNALRTGWHANEPLFDWPQPLTNELVRERYSQDSWNFRL